ncbi:hypothetical protein ACQ5SK_10335 [Bradyrhizobium japonicum]
MLVGQDDVVQNAFFRGNRRDARGNAGAEIANRTRQDLHRSAAGDDLALGEGQLFQMFERNAQLAA